MFVEKDLSRRGPAILAILFIFLTFPNLWLPELTPLEARNTMVAREMIASGNLLLTRFQGEPMVVPPLAPWLLSLTERAAVLGEVGTRLVAVIPLALLSILSGWVSYRSAGRRPALVTAAAVMSSGVALRLGTIGETDLLFALLINGAWLVWYALSREKKRWLYAWSASHLIICLAILTAGAKALFFFYFPLVLLRRPLAIRRRLAQADHIVSFLLMTALIVLWIFMVPNLLEGVMEFFRVFTPRAAAHGYVERFLLFPMKTVLGYFPWVFLVWPAFCIAYRPLEKDPVLCRYLRTIVITFFLFFWLIPGGQARMLTPLVGPLSILLGMNYEILVRRHGAQLMILAKAIGWLNIVGLTLSAILVILCVVGVFEFQFTFTVTAISLVFASISLIVTVFLLLTREPWPIWLVVLIAVMVLNLSYVSVAGVYAFERQSGARRLAAEFASRIATAGIVYLDSDEVSAEVCYYLRQPVVRLSRDNAVATGDPRVADQLPIYEKEVYVIGRERSPRSRNREWEPVGEAVVHNVGTFQIWRGTRR